MDVTAKARELRRLQTESEKTFWNEVRNSKIGLKFVRQKPILFSYLGRKHSFYADFYCSQKKLIIEIDGKIHENQKEYDKYREEIISNLGYRMIRVKNEEIEQNMDMVIQRIRNI